VKTWTEFIGYFCVTSHLLDVNLQSQKNVSSVAIQKALYSSLPSEYLVNIGWVSYIDGLQVQRPYLIQLVALPSMRMAEMWPNDSEGWSIECGLLGLYSFLAEYLWHANCHVNACDDLIRVGLTASVIAQSGNQYPSGVLLDPLM
jgi:hypothetical protein